MAARDKSKKKNAAGFTKRQLKLLLYYCYSTRENPKMSITKIHKKCGTYLRRKSTEDAVNKAYARKVITGPELFVNSGIEVSLMNDVDNPRKVFEDCKNDPMTSFAVISHGYWPILLCKVGANTLQYYDSILPSKGCTFDKDIKRIFFEEKGTLPTDSYPHRWYEEHWNTYRCLKYPRNITFREAEKKLNINWVSVRQYFLEILKQCKVMTNLFPLGAEAYSPLLITLKTKYEIGIVRGLKTLDRTSYLYKAENTLILLIGTNPIPRAQNHLADKFQRLEDVGLISDLHISTPIDWHRAF